MAEKGKRMRWREVFNKQTIVSLVIILGLTAFGIAYLSIRPGSRSLHPEEAKVEAYAEWEDYPLGPDRLLNGNNAGGTGRERHLLLP